MPVDIPLRRQLPPSRAGVAKQPFSLADRSGEIELGRSLAEFGGDMLDRLIKTRAANEESEAIGIMNAEIEGFRTFVASKPNAPFEEYQKEIDRRIKNIDALGQNATTKLSRTNITNLIARNKLVIKGRFQTTLAEKVSKIELAKYQVQRENLINNFDKRGLANLNAEQVGAGLLNKELTIEQQKQDFDTIDLAEQEVMIGNAVGNLFGIWQSTITEADPDGDLNVALDVLNADPNIPEGEKQEIGSELKTRVQNQRAETKLNAEQDFAQSQESVNTKLNKNEFSGIDGFIEQLPITSTQKIEEKARVQRYIKTINSYKDNAITAIETRIKVLNVISDVKQGLLTKEQGLDAYNEIAKAETFDRETREGTKLFPIKTSDGDRFTNDIFAAAESAKSVVARRQNAVLKEREKQLRDAIEKQPSFFPAEEAEEILKDLANQAVIDLNDKFREGDVTKEEVDTEVNRLMIKYALTASQQLRAVSARQFRLAESLEQQQESLIKLIASLRKDGQVEEAKEILDEAIARGIFESETKDGEIKKKKGKKINIGKGLLNRLTDRFTKGK